MSVPERLGKQWKLGSLVLGAGLLLGCTTSFPLSLIDGGMQEDAQALEAGVDTGTPDTGTPDTGTSDAGQPDAQVGVCGDGDLNAGETCDDGNTVAGDGCSDACEVECANASTVDCNATGETLNAAAAFVDHEPPAGFIQCAGFENTSANDVGPNWEANCLGTALTLRLRYWDTSTDPWTLLGDATLAPTSDASYVEQLFDVTNNGGSEGVLETQGVSLLKDDPGVTPVTTWVCNAGHPVQEYAASDLYFGTQMDNDSVVVCGWSDGDDASSPCEDAEELLMAAAGFGVCANGGHTDTLAIAIYQQL